MVVSNALSGGSNSSSHLAGHAQYASFAFLRRVSLDRYSVFTRKAPFYPLRHRFNGLTISLDGDAKREEKEWDARSGANDGGFGRREERRISGIHVPRKKHISISKADLLEAILEMFDEEDAVYFRKFSLKDLRDETPIVADGSIENIINTHKKEDDIISSLFLKRKCLDSILHVEHQEKLEEMRRYYFPSYLEDHIQRTQFSAPPEENTSASNGSMVAVEKETKYPGEIESNKPPYLHDRLDPMSFLQSFYGKAVRKTSLNSPRVAVTTHFQQCFMKLLYNAQYEELSAEDLLLAKSLNSDYLLTLPIYVDWKRASESHAIIFRRGYATERQKGLLIAEKLDYLQSALLQGIFLCLSRPLKELGKWLYEALNSFNEGQKLLAWINEVKLALKDQYSLERTWSFGENFPENQLEPSSIRNGDLPLWLAAQRAVHRYKGFLSLDGPRGRLMKELLTWAGLIPPMAESSIYFDRGAQHSEKDFRLNFLQRITLNNLWEPASSKSCGGNPWKMLRTAVSILFSNSVLQEPAFEELIFLYTEEPSQRKDTEKSYLPLHLKIYERIPIPDLSVIFPHKKLSFRILDTVRLDIASIIGFLAFFLNYKFENILSSPSAVILDVIATTAFVAFVSRVILGYKQTWDRYQLLVNRTLYEKTLASGFGSVYFLLDASEQQQYKEALLLYAILLQPKNYQVGNGKCIGNECEMFLHDKFNEQIEMPIDKAMDTLIRLGLVSEFPFEGDLKAKVVPCSKACKILSKRWNDFLNS